MGLTESGLRSEQAVGGSDALRVSGLTVRYGGSQESVAAVRDVSFDVGTGEIVGLVGESGSGKTSILMALMGLMDTGAQVSADSLEINGSSILDLEQREYRRIRGRILSMVFQDPVSAFNPSLPVLYQLERVLRLNRDDLSTRSARRAEAFRLLRMVGINPEVVVGKYPHEMSQGQLQRVLIGSACSSKDIKLLLADEPTASLDVTIAAQVLELLRSMREELGVGMLLVTHDLAIVAETCDRVVVLYSGSIVEMGFVEDVFASPKHPYTSQLLKSIPKFPRDGQRLYGMRGSSDDASLSRHSGCVFAARCDQFMKGVCDVETPLLEAIDDTGRLVACHLYRDFPGREAFREE